MKRVVVDLNEEENDLLWEMIDKYHDACEDVDDYVSIDILEDPSREVLKAEHLNMTSDSCDRLIVPKVDDYVKWKDLEGWIYYIDEKNVYSNH